jgi:SAM-dependent methyltransferase
VFEAPRPPDNRTPLGADVWDLVSGVSDANPTDSRWTRAIARLVGSTLPDGPRRPWRVLDLGAGPGNPAIGLAALGHTVVAVDLDPWMAERCDRRAGVAGVSIDTHHTDWRGLAAGDLLALSGGQPFDLICCLGNALAYQDSWPDQEVPCSLSSADLGVRFRAWSGALARGAVILLEVAIEPSTATRREYQRTFTGLSGLDGEPLRSVWNVSVSPRGQRAVDTHLLRDAANRRTETVARVVYRGHALTHELIADGAKRVGVTALAVPDPLRQLPLTTYILRPGES